MDIVTPLHPSIEIPRLLHLLTYLDASSFTETRKLQTGDTIVHRSIHSLLSVTQCPVQLSFVSSDRRLFDCLHLLIVACAHCACDRRSRDFVVKLTDAGGSSDRVR